MAEWSDNDVEQGARGLSDYESDKGSDRWEDMEDFDREGYLEAARAVLEASEAVPKAEYDRMVALARAALEGSVPADQEPERESCKTCEPYPGEGRVPMRMDGAGVMGIDGKPMMDPCPDRSCSLPESPEGKVEVAAVALWRSMNGLRVQGPWTEFIPFARLALDAAKQEPTHG